jgi:crotonobetainyl-CoA:carnitine CoA-transferase CaiB-like acyl-CoA transferase
LLAVVVVTSSPREVLAEIFEDLRYPSVTTSALGDLRIIDFSRVLAGPLATMVLADFGATVVKVERPGIGDDTRAWGPPYDADGEATYFQSVNRNKSSVVIDLGSDDGRARARSLVAGADVIVENFRPGVMERLGLGWDELHADDPALVYCSITGFGAGGGASLTGYDLLVQAVGGLMSITGSPDGEPQKVGVALVDVISGLFATVGILTALRHRSATGEGQRVEVDLLSSLLAALVNQASAYTGAGVVGQRMGNRHPSIAPYEPFACRDGELVIAVGNDRQFGALCDVVGLAADSRFESHRDRVENRDALHAELESRLRERDVDDWLSRLSAAGVPAGRINDIAQAFTFASSLGLEPIVSVEGKPTTRNPIRLSATPATYRSAPPLLGGGGGA